MKFAKHLCSSSKKRGFSLTELIIVIVIMGILMAAVFLGGSNSIGSAKESQVKSDLRNMAIYVEDMMDNTPALQYSEKYADGECTSYDAKSKTLTGYNNIDITADKGAASAAYQLDSTHVTGNFAAEGVLKLLNDDFLTSDFQLSAAATSIATKDAWENPYLFSYNQVASTGTGKSSSCVVVINSIGVNALDETSDANKVVNSSNTSTSVAAEFAKWMKEDANQKAFTSAEDFVNKNLKDANGEWLEAKIGDDYGVVIVMIDGAVSTAYYGF